MGAESLPGQSLFICDYFIFPVVPLFGWDGIVLCPRSFFSRCFRFLDEFFVTIVIGWNDIYGCGISLKKGKI